MVSDIVVLSGLLLGLASALAIEDFRNRQRVRRIPLRIMVNGSRGKSSVTRLIAGALRAAGVRTVAKTTGSSPRVIYPDGSESIIRRIGPPTVKEQMEAVKFAVEQGAKALVIECMALQPFNQWISEHRMVYSTVGVCTNVRADHLDVMGPTVADVERALAGTVPRRGTFVTAERVHNQVLKEACRRLETRYIEVTEEDLERIGEAELSRFSYIEHRENVALALKVAEVLGIEREVALKGMWETNPDIGVLRRYDLRFHGKDIIWLNAFAANDPDSYRLIFERLEGVLSIANTRIVVVNCRHDRPDRSAQLGVMAAQLRGIDRFILVGSGTEVFARRAVAEGVDSRLLYTMAGERVEKVFERIVAWSGSVGAVVGIGNIKGIGLELDEYFRNRALKDSSFPSEAHQ